MLSFTCLYPTLYITHSYCVALTVPTLLYKDFNPPDAHTQFWVLTPSQPCELYAVMSSPKAPLSPHVHALHGERSRAMTYASSTHSHCRLEHQARRFVRQSLLCNVRSPSSHALIELVALHLGLGREVFLLEQIIFIDKINLLTKG